MHMPPVEEQTLRKVALRLPWPKAKRTQSAPPVTAHVSGINRQDEHDVEQQRLRCLNQDLEVLAKVFPDVRPTVFRELLASFSADSRLFLITEALLMNSSRVVKGRWRSLDQQTEEAGVDARAIARGQPAIADHELFRSEAYKAVVKAAFYEEFPSLSHSAIRGILMEQNYSYTESRPLLLQLNSQSWRASLANLFYRRKHPSLLRHPFITWPSDAAGSTSDPMLRLTPSAELNDELSNALLEPRRRDRIETQITQDLAMAEAVNEEEAEAEGAMYDCQCCFMPNAFERLSLCTDQNHYLCFRCLRHTMSEALYGQGWAQSIDLARCTIKCIAPDSGVERPCTGTVPQYSVKRALLCDKGGLENWQKFEGRLLNDSLKASELPLTRCPFCEYAEIYPGNTNELNTTITKVMQVLFSNFYLGPLCYLGLAHVIRFVLRAFTAIIVALLLALCLKKYIVRFAPDIANHYLGYVRETLWAAFQQSPAMNIGRPSVSTSLGPPPTGTKFLCRNPTCSTPSCSSCHAAWIDPHTCHPRLHASLRTHVEAALTAATTRTCPLCHLSFVKSSGCNKLECPCGYRMCYLCRKDVRDEGYAHFCGHFRATGTGNCPVECGRCDLYRDDSTSGADGRGGSTGEEAMEEVRRKAEEEWWQIEATKQVSDEAKALRESGSANAHGAAPVDDTARRKQRWGLLERKGKSYA